MLIINNNITWSDLTSHLSPNQMIELDQPPEASLFKKIAGCFTGSTPVTDKMYNLVKTRIHDYLIEKNDNVDLEDKLIDSVAQQLLRECSVSYRELNQTDAMAKIFHKMEENIIECFKSPLQKKEAKTDSKNSFREQAAMLFGYLMGASFDPEKVTWPLVKAILFQENHEFKEAFKDVLVETAQEIGQLITSGEIGKEHQRLAEILIGNILALIPFAEPVKGSVLSLPQKIHGQWQQVNYTVDVLPLNPDWLGGTMPAFGLTPQEPAPEGAQRLLLFRGTSHPTGSGFLCTLLADSIPGHSVGEFIYNRFSKDTVAAWINAEKDDSKKIKIYGMSLGGALAWHVQQHHPEKVEEVNIYGSPTPFDRNKKCSFEEQPVVNAYVNEGDPIPYAGMGPPSHWNMYMLFVAASRPFILAHAALYSAFSDVVVMKIDPQTDRRSIIRKIINVVHHILIFFTLPIIVTLIALRALKCFVVSVWQGQGQEHTGPI